MRAALDTNVLVYAEGLNGEDKKATALDLIRRLPNGNAVVSAQVLGELFSVLIRKSQKSTNEARAAVLRWHDAFPVSPISAATVLSAVDLAIDHRLGIWDAVILSASADADCRVLLTEDLHEGFTWRGVTVINPFASRPHPLMAALFDPG